jgi:hypothetical protein
VFITDMYGGESGAGNVLQFELPSTRASADAQMPVGDTAYAVELGTTLAHAQSPAGVASRITGQMKNPTNEPFNMHLAIIVAAVIVGLILIHRAFKGAVI